MRSASRDRVWPLIALRCIMVYCAHSATRCVSDHSRCIGAVLQRGRPGAHRRVRPTELHSLAGLPSASQCCSAAVASLWLQIGVFVHALASDSRREVEHLLAATRADHPDARVGALRTTAPQPL